MSLSVREIYTNFYWGKESSVRFHGLSVGGPQNNPFMLPPCTYLHTSFHNCSAQPPTARQQKAQLCWYVHAKSILAPTCLFLSGRRMLRARAMALLVPEMSCSLIMQVAAAGNWASDAFSSCLIRVRWQIMERQADARR
jgi:hypothetical protein